MKKRSLKITPYHLIAGLENWVSRNPEGPLYEKPLDSEPTYSLRKADVNLLMHVGGTRQILSFRAATILPQEAAVFSGDFFVHTDGLKRDKVAYVEDSLREAQESLDKAYSRGESGAIRFSLREFSKIFASPAVAWMDIGFEKKFYEGIRVSYPLNSIPLGAEGHLSENLFYYAEKGIAQPLRTIVVP